MNARADTKAVVVGVDGSTSSIAALRKAAELASTFGHPLEVITTWQFPISYDRTLPPAIWSPEADAQAILDATADEVFGADRPDHLTLRVVPGPAAAVLIKRSEEAELLVVGSRGHGGFAGLLLGSVSTACAQHAQCPVLIMHAPRTAHPHPEPLPLPEREQALR
ncbi:universal stress protein [Microbacterium sp. RU33B]|uniref:universal stress protein n=1 Tax=Microbacterium sp. RU33B TaxID=1907390 RepID=UPI0009655D9B|nr:universal stress protein [Microbacterium sp. RU33B]SIT69401.1 Nucleotide-binding universal stress protein, UspA family [Microbacterium sp. RU33B]